MTDRIEQLRADLERARERFRWSRQFSKNPHIRAACYRDLRRAEVALADATSPAEVTR